MIPISFMRSNSDLASASLSGGRRLACACTGGPLVGMKCSTPCLVEGWENLGTVMSGYSASSMSYLSVEAEMASR